MSLHFLNVNAPKGDHYIDNQPLHEFYTSQDLGLRLRCCCTLGDKWTGSAGCLATVRLHPDRDEERRKAREEGWDGSVENSIKGYNALFDPNMRHFFETPSVQGHLLKTGQVRPAPDEGGELILRW